MVAEEDFVSKNDMVVDKGFVTKSVEVSQNDLAKENLEKKSLAKGSQSLDMGSHRPQKAPRRSQLEVWYKGRFRRTADGLGKRSPGIRTSSSRSRSKSKGAAGLAAAFWSEVESFTSSLAKQDRLRMMASLALGKYESSPFGEKIQEMKKRLDEVVVALGKKPERRKGDRKTEIQFRRLKAWAELVEDEDHTYLHAMASRGVPVGARGEIGRVSDVYDPKVKGESEGHPPTWEEEFQQSDRDNYRSATEHLDKVRLHIEEDIKKGWVIEMSREEAERRFGDELQIASLGAVPKDQQWSDVRVVHDGTHGIQVNSRITQPNRMEFPQFDDLQSVLRAFQLDDPKPKMLCAFDIKSAHRLIPIQPEDWGLLAFRLEEGGPVFCNTVGTFGASASFWWGRVAGTLFRVLHRVLPWEALMYLLLFADDGLILAGGEDYHRYILVLEENKGWLLHGVDWLHGRFDILDHWCFSLKGKLVGGLGEVY